MLSFLHPPNKDPPNFSFHGGGLQIEIDML